MEIKKHEEQLKQQKFVNKMEKHERKRSVLFDEHQNARRMMEIATKQSKDSPLSVVTDLNKEGLDWLKDIRNRYVRLNAELDAIEI